MKKLVKEVGLSALILVGGGKGGGAIIQQLTKLLSSSAYDRKLETEADMNSVDYMVKANINSGTLCQFSLSHRFKSEKDVPKEVYWISTHPESEKRAQEILQHLKTKKITKRPLMQQSEWDAFKSAVEKL